MGETLNVNVLVAAKDEYTRQLITLIQYDIYDIISNIFIKSQENNIKRRLSYSNFQLELKKVPTWANFKLDEMLSNINTKYPYLMDLITAIFVSHVKILACVRLKSDDKSIKIKVPNLNSFLHKIIIAVSEQIYYKPVLINEEKYKIIDIITKCISDTISNQVPIEYILNEYLSGVFDEDENDTNPESLQANIDQEPINTVKEEHYFDNSEKIPLLPIEKPVVPKQNEGITSFDDLKDKIKDEIKVNKKESNIEDSDPEPDEDSDSDPEEDSDSDSEPDEEETYKMIDDAENKKSDKDSEENKKPENESEDEKIDDNSPIF